MVRVVHKLTTGLAATYGTIVVEDLHVAGMLANRRLALSERTYRCTGCGLVLDRDVNAAVNLAKLAGSGPDSNGRGGTLSPGLAGHVPVKRQPGTAHAGKTGTAAPQGTAAA